ncbi:HupE/UreJ family protein [Halopseudomonas laoshanensis]|uniref:HupE/UreJ family protein n=1 Tax=Halopseudomonas laoshanensis TaxID=2268758 RepID=A0A7V7GTB2_9GAMM|nr:HupE/UreJ family protein [Halopseudomonas laoshanensis]KAA0694224.1 HupE/UreJ family protein [Halopseudomonas laoshanensis]
MKSAIIIALLAFLMAGSAHAHKASDSFLYWQPAVADAPGRLDIALVDLARTVTLDGDGDGQVRWGEVLDRQASIKRYLTTQLLIMAGDLQCQVDWRMAGMTQHSDGNYLVVTFRPDCFSSAIIASDLNYNLFFDQDPLHRALVMTRIEGSDRLTVLSPDQRTLTFAHEPGIWQTAAEFIWEGMVHLWIGYDHMLFLLALLLPAAVRRERGRWVVEDKLSKAVKDVALIVTAFTVAHSVTLVIATLGVVRLPIEWVETFIALSIVAAAVNIVWPFLGQRRYLVGFGFGLIHGFGFASVLADFMSDTSSRLIALASFNIGVELAQLVVVLAVLPVIFLLRRHWFYQRVVMPAGVVIVALTGSVWAWERVPL